LVLVDGAVMLRSLEGNRRSGVALAMRHRLWLTQSAASKV